MNGNATLSVIIRTIIIAFIASILLSVEGAGQESKPAAREESPVGTLRLFEQQPQADSLSMLPPLTLRTLTMEFPGVLYRPSAASPQFLTWKIQEKPDLAAPWKLQLAEENRYRTLRMVLGSIQVGGVAYLMYEHFKRK